MNLCISFNSNLAKKVTLSGVGQDINWTVSCHPVLGVVGWTLLRVFASRDGGLPVVVVAVDLGRHLSHSEKWQGEVVLRWDGEGWDCELFGWNLQTNLVDRQLRGGHNRRDSQVLRGLSTHWQGNGHSHCVLVEVVLQCTLPVIDNNISVFPFYHQL